MNKTITPHGIPAPEANYAHAVLSDGVRRILHTSGVVPVDGDGVVPDSVAEQASVVWSNIGAMLDEAGMEVDDVVAVVTYVVAGENLDGVMRARDEALGGHLAASTLVTVPALARPEWKVEIAIVAVD